MSFGVAPVDLPDHPEMHVDEVLVAGEHLAFGEVVEMGLAAIADVGDCWSATATWITLPTGHGQFMLRPGAVLPV